jgi:hypothetical protein
MPPKSSSYPPPVPLIDELKDTPIEECYRLAVEPMHASGYHLNSNTKLSYCCVIKLNGVYRTTLERQFKETAKPHATAHKNQQKLTLAQEEVLVQWAWHMGSCGVPLT